MLPHKKSLSWIPTLLGEFIGNDYTLRHFERPPINIIDTEKSYIIEIAAPGVNKDDLEIDLVGENQLKIKIECKNCTAKNPIEGQKYLRKEFCCYKFEQTLILPENVDKENISAKKDEGIIKIDIPKKSKEIELKTITKIEVK